MNYESPIEVVFGERILTYLHVDTVLETQVELETPWATFRLDFLLTGQTGRQVAIECDGRQYHDAVRDEFRDAIILGEELVDSIFRISGQSLWFDLLFDLAIAELARVEPTLFDQHAVDALRRRSEFEMRAALGEFWCTPGKPSFERYRSRLFKEADPHWLRLYGWAVGQGPMPFYELHQRRLGPKQT